MRTLLRRLSAALLLAASVLYGSQDTQATFQCTGWNCDGNWGNLVNTTCFYDPEDAETAEDECADACNNSILVFGNGVCVCNDGFLCPTCSIGPDDCDPQTPFNAYSCSCQGSPAIVDTRGDGLRLTNLEAGVKFDLTGDGQPESMAWTAAGSDDAFLALDRDGDGSITSGIELFGSITPQPASETPNAFEALAVFDKRRNGGNGDGKISRLDAVFERLVLWTDLNHDGRSQPREIEPIRESTVRAIALDYEESARVDPFGNAYRYRARIFDTVPRTKWVWDVFLTVAPLTSTP